jgi:uncharacterized membrane protein
MVSAEPLALLCLAEEAGAFPSYHFEWVSELVGDASGQVVRWPASAPGTTGSTRWPD